MFRTVRHWWSEGSGQHTARLFLFEFVVVVAGVLVAQGLANWVSDRSALAHMEEARSRTKRELSDNLDYAMAWRAAVPCIGGRLRDIMRGASEGAVPANLLDRPRFPPFIITPMDDQAELLMRRRYGERNADVLNVLRAEFEAANRPIDAMIRAWGRLGLADRANGKVTPADRDQVRIAAADISANLGSLDNLLGQVSTMARVAGIRAHSEDRIRPAVRCDEIWQHGNVAIPQDGAR